MLVSDQEQFEPVGSDSAYMPLQEVPRALFLSFHCQGTWWMSKSCHISIYEDKADAVVVVVEGGSTISFASPQQEGKFNQQIYTYKDASEIRDVAD
jgi:hypothetical protein